MTIVGIDLGTTNSAIAFMKDGIPTIIENRDGDRTTPSVVQYNSNGEIVVGSVAKRMIASVQINQTVIEAKRKMGSDEHMMLGNKEYRAEEISALILKELKQSAEERLGHPVNRAVITVPAYFSDAQRVATRHAGELAGFHVERIINEPTAAALAYGYEHSGTGRTVLVYDLGGGTFDVSIVCISEGLVEVLATSGNNHLGGSDFDWLITEWIREDTKKSQGVDLFEIGSKDEITQMKTRIKEEAEKAKKSLSFVTEVPIHIPFVVANENTVIHIQTTLTRSIFERLIKDLAESTLDEIDVAMVDANLSVDDIDEVLLVGGSSRIPYIAEIVTNKFNKAPLKNVNPDEVVAAGAAISAATISGDVPAEKELVITDVCPYTLGTEIVKWQNDQYQSGFFDPLIERNVTIPTEQTNTYFTMRDNQTDVAINIYQGDHEHCRDNIFIYSIAVNDIPAAPEGEQGVDVTFKYNVDGILEVVVRVNSTGKIVRGVISTQIGVMQSNEIVSSKQKLNEQWQHSSAIKEMKNLMYRAEKMMETVGEADRHRIVVLLDKLRATMDNRDDVTMRKVEEELQDLLIELF